MKNINWFKIVLLTILTAIAVILFRYSQILNDFSQNGRYLLSNQGTLIIDTRNGMVYSIYENEDRKNNAIKISNELTH